MKCSLEREPHLHVDEELLVPKDEPQLWISHKRRFMEWKRPLMHRQPSEGGSALQKLSDWLKMQRRL